MLMTGLAPGHMPVLSVRERVIPPAKARPSCTHEALRRGGINSHQLQVSWSSLLALVLCSSKQAVGSQPAGAVSNHGQGCLDRHLQRAPRGGGVDDMHPGPPCMPARRRGIAAGSMLPAPQEHRAFQQLPACRVSDAMRRLTCWWLGAAPGRAAAGRQHTLPQPRPHRCGGGVPAVHPAHPPTRKSRSELL